MRSEAVLDLEGSASCARRLVAHLAGRHGGRWCEEHQQGWVDLGFGRAELACGSAGLRLTVEGAAKDLDRLEDIVGRHVLRFAECQQGLVQWRRDDGTGSIQGSPVRPELTRRS